MVSLTQWTWVWVNSRSWWWTKIPGFPQSMGLQSVGHDWETEVNWSELATVSSRSCFCWLLHFGCKKYNQSGLSIDYLVMLMCWIFFWVVEKGCLLSPMRSLDKTLLCFSPASFSTPMPNLPFTAGIVQISIFAFQSAMMKWTFFVCLFVLTVVGLPRASQLQLVGVSAWGIDFGLLWW